MNESTKQKISRLARNMGLLSLLDSILYQLDRARHRRANVLFARRHPDFLVPPASLAFEAFGHTNNETYYSTGIAHARMVGDFARKYVNRAEPAICEWGCGPGRIVRHLPRELAAQKATIWGVDFNPESIAWCRTNIRGVRFESNGLHPPLPFPDGSFDFIYALSVLTHLDESGWKEWLSELSRVIRDDGIVFFTTHGRNYLNKLLPDEQAAFRAGSPVFRAKTALGKKAFAAYHPAGFVHANLPPRFQVLVHHEETAMFALSQDVWVVRKTAR